MSAVASSSKRPLPADSLSTPKRARVSPTKDSASPEDDEDDLEPMDDAARAKQARKDARTIRNRESAQRSRNQRKAHLSYLEARVMELEAENKALRGEGRATRENSPTTSILSLTTSSPSQPCVNLASVAPPPVDIDIKPSVEHVVPTSTNDITLSSLQAENTALKERITMLESLVKQVVAVSNLGGLTQPNPTSNDNLNMDSLLVPKGMSETLSPSFPPATDSTNSIIPPITSELSSSSNLACHPAAGEEIFDFGSFSSDYSTIGNGSSSSDSIGETERSISGFDSQAEMFGETATTIEGDDETGRLMDVEDWDRGMQKLLEELGGNQGDIQVKEENGMGLEWALEDFGMELTA